MEGADGQQLEGDKPADQPSASDPRDDHAAESERLGGRPALRTMLVLAAGSFLANLTNSLYGVVDSIWVQRAVGDKGMTAISTYKTHRNGFFNNAAFLGIG
jgi:Na+-driven multidrug efflux pump